jgi:hypothetical protein
MPSDLSRFALEGQGDVIALFPESESMLQECTHRLRFFGQLIQYPPR